MRLTDLNGKEIINLADGRKLGVVYRPEALLDLREGRVESLLVSSGGNWLWRKEMEIPWSAMKKISEELILVDYKPAQG